MPSDCKPNLLLPIAVAALALLAGYVGAYYANVTPSPATGCFNCPVYTYLPFYRFQRGVSESFFYPIHQFDRRLRPHVWNP